MSDAKPHGSRTALPPQREPSPDPGEIRPHDVWEDAIRRHDRRVYLSVLALGLAPDRAREVTQAAWTRLMEQHQRGALAEIELPGLAIRQARFLAFNELERSRVERRVLAAVPDPPEAPDTERVVGGREEIERVLAALATCSPTARKVFRLVYATPGGTAATAAASVGLSLQRVRQILCETRRHIRRALAEDQP
jgi:DNA-directed RNA polymerase specialized sigma24 family protein